MKHLFIQKINTPVGKLTLIGDDTHLYLLEFDNEERLDKQQKALQKAFPHTLKENDSAPLKSIKEELTQYFCGKLQKFNTPIKMIGTPFQIKVWNELLNTPFGTTKSYKTQAEAIGYDKGFRAVANANGKNKLSIIVPCHRIIASNGKLGGYGGGITRKQQLLDLESTNCQSVSSQ